MLGRFGSDLSGLRVVVDCANGAYSGLAPDAFRRLGAEVNAIGSEPDGSNINVGCGATDMALLQETVTISASTSESPSTATVTGCSRSTRTAGWSTETGSSRSSRSTSASVDLVAVTQMTNHGFHALMREHGIRVVTTDVGDRYVLEALARERGVLGGEQSGHVIYLREHVTGDGLAAALLLCAALRGRRLSEAADVMPRFCAAQGERPGDIEGADSRNPRGGRSRQRRA